MVMIHRADVDDSNGKKLSTFQKISLANETTDHKDPFLPDEANPMETEALESSLWELVSHTSHYHAPVSTMCKIFSEAFTKPGYNMEDFLDHTYNTVSFLYLYFFLCVSS